MIYNKYTHTSIQTLTHTSTHTPHPTRSTPVSVPWKRVTRSTRLTSRQEFKVLVWPLICPPTEGYYAIHIVM